MQCSISILTGTLPLTFRHDWISSILSNFLAGLCPNSIIYHFSIAKFLVIYLYTLYFSTFILLSTQFNQTSMSTSLPKLFITLPLITNISPKSAVYFSLFVLLDVNYIWYSRWLPPLEIFYFPGFYDTKFCWLPFFLMNYFCILFVVFNASA